jgi:hypothetical protein
MKGYIKTNKMATIQQGSTSVERRVYKDEKDAKCVKLNGSWFEIDWLVLHGKIVTEW